MSKESSTSRCSARNTSWKNSQVETNENELETMHSSIHFPPARTPLNSIPDPSQCHKESHEAEVESQSKVGAEIRSARFLDKKIESCFDRNASGGNQKVLSRGGGKLHSEPNSAQTTPARNPSRVSLGGGSRVTQHNGGGSSARLLKGISFGDVGLPNETSHFNLEEEPSYWRDHNVQVFIRIRPLSTMEKISQGYGLCLRQESAQTLVWLGHPETRFTFDHVACETISQESLFRVAGVPMVENCMSGYNSCMFAYGQTGSGKTYTMMGEIHGMEERLDKDSGITPRIFEYLFTRISAEENIRKGEKLKYSCKCSFLEIYNEQVTDLLEPSSANLQLREDLKKGVYVENLTEHSVKSVHDVLKLLQQGSANRKIAATNMNGESSRSHSVFTCIIESHWEKDSMTHFRFARLNLVDLAGSERQKSSGAEGDRLKEAANINKSLSTLGLVIMSLVDLAHGKQRHVPYRDSRLTFLLQDSLGGNSKTMIIANVSPSICSANETLSTLKFAQRAKLIQNNAKVNEDASGNITALHRQIEQLKGELSFLMDQKSVSRALPNLEQSPGNYKFSSLSKEYNFLTEGTTKDSHQIHLLSRETKCLKAALVGALRREKMAETVSEGLKNEIERLNSLVSQREDEVEHAMMKLKLNEEKTKRLELFVGGTLSAEKFLFEENKALQEEIQFLQTRYDTNSEITRLGLENHRLLEQIRLIQNFGEQGERERLLIELSELRNQLLGTIEGDLILSKCNEKKQDTDVGNELEYCRNLKNKLIREVDELQTKVQMYLSPPFSESALSSSSECIDEAHKMDRWSMVETMSIRSNSVDEIPCHAWENIGTLLNLVGGSSHDNSVMQIQGLPSLFEAMKNEETCPTSAMPLIMQADLRLKETCSPKDKEDTESISQSSRFVLVSEEVEKSNEDLLLQRDEDVGWELLQTKSGMNNINILDELKFSDSQCQEKLKLFYQNPFNLVHDENEMDTAKIVQLLQGKVISLQSEVHKKLCCMAQENVKLQSALALKEKEIKALKFQWERSVLELTDFLVDGSKSLRDATGQVESISYSFPLVNAQISEHIERAVKVFVGKEETIQLLQRSLEDAQNMVQDLELNFASLKAATMALNESQQADVIEGEENAMQEKILLNEKINIANIVDHELKCDEVQHYAIPVSTVAALRFSDRFEEDNDAIAISDHVFSKICSEGKANHLTCKYLVDHAERTELGAVKMENAFNAFCLDAKMQVEDLDAKMSSASEYKNFIWNLLIGIQDFGKKLKELKIKGRISQPCLMQTSSRGVHDGLNFKKMLHILHKINKELTETSEKLSLIEKFIKREGDSFFCPWIDEDSTEVDIRSVDCSSSDSDSLEGSIGSGNKDDASNKCSPINSEKTFEQTKEFPESGGHSQPRRDEKRLNNSEYLPNEATICWLRAEFHSSFISFNELFRQLSALFKELDDGYYYFRELKGVPPQLELQIETVEEDRLNGSEVSGQEETNPGDIFFSKFEEAHETIREADLMLNALIKANHNAKQLSEMWKVAGEDLIAQRASLTKEIEQLKSLISDREKETEMLKDHAHESLIEIADSIAYVEKQFLQMQRDVENELQKLHSDVFLVGHETLLCINNLRSSLEDISSQLMETRVMSSVLYHCYKDKVFHKLLNAKHNDYPLRLEESKCILPAIEGSSEEENQSEVYGVSYDRPMYEILALRKELGRKEELLEGLLFDLRLLQESASKKKDIEDENDKLRITVRQAQQELDKKLNELNDIIAEYRKLQGYVADTEIDLSQSTSELGHAKEIIRHLSYQNEDLRGIVKDLNTRISEAEEQLEQKEVIKCFDKELFSFTCSSEEQQISSLDAIEEELRRVIGERDKLQEGVSILNDKLVMAYALADENEAIATEARQESEASKMYAEQKEEEVNILEKSVEELEYTINVLEEKVHEMDEEVGSHRLIKDSLEVELQSLRQRLLAVENLPQIADSESIYLQQAEEQMSRQLQDKLLEAHKRIGVLEEEKEEQEKEIKQYREYISEVLLHAEAQSLQYQQKYKSLESMARELKSKVSSSTSTPSTMDKCEKLSTRTRGSSSPFRCIANLVHQMNLEKDHELSMARAQIQELEALASSKQKEVCLLNSRLAAVESMTHDVIRDLLGVKLDITGYANLIEQSQILKLVEDAKHHKEELFAKEEEILYLRRQVDDLIEERERCLLELKNTQADVLSTQINLTQLQERGQLLSAENEGLKIYKRNLMRKVAELDEMVKNLIGTQTAQVQPLQQMSKIMRGSLKHGEPDLERRLSQSEKILSRLNNELARYHHPGSSSLRGKTSQTGKNNKTSSTPIQ